MEHRWNARTAVSAHAIVYHPRFGSCVGSACDASLGGAFIELSGGGYPRGAPVTLSLPFADARGSELLQLGAVVVRADDVGIGVMLLDHGEAATRMLRRWIDASRRPRVRGRTAQVIPFPARATSQPIVLVSPDADAARMTGRGSTPTAGTEASS